MIRCSEIQQKCFGTSSDLFEKKVQQQPVYHYHHVKAMSSMSNELYCDGQEAGLKKESKCDLLKIEKRMNLRAHPLLFVCSWLWKAQLYIHLSRIHPNIKKRRAKRQRTGYAQMNLLSTPHISVKSLGLVMNSNAPSFLHSSMSRCELEVE
jgi:hypothetical protein